MVTSLETSRGYSQPKVRALICEVQLRFGNKVMRFELRDLTLRVT